MRVVTATYVGNGGVGNRAITGVGFTPAMVWIRHASAADIVWRASTAPLARIVSLDTDGFTIQADQASVNEDTITFYYVAFGTDTAVLSSGSYTGNGVSPRTITGVGFQPSFVNAIGDGSTGMTFWTNQKGGDNTYTWPGGTPVATLITGVTADGFTVDAARNVNGTLYHWYALQETTGNLDTGVYIGNGLDNVNIGTPFTPLFVQVTRETASPGSFRHEDLTGDNSWFDASFAQTINHIQAIGTSNFQVGTAMNVNLANFFWLVFRDLQVPAPALPASSLVVAPTPSGAIFQIPDQPYSSYKTLQQIHGLLTGARFL